MEKEAASEFSEINIENTYQKYIKELEEEAKDKQRRRKICKKLVLVLSIVIFIIGAIVIVAIPYINITKERNTISECINTKKYDNAFSIMISSNNYTKLKSEFGTVLWQKQNELDKNFKKHSWIVKNDTYADSDTKNLKEILIYNEEYSRDGICYYEHITNNGKNYMYAVLENGDYYEILSDSDASNPKINIYGLGYDSWNYYVPETIWSNGWLFICKAEELSDGAYQIFYQYAIKYDKTENKVYKVEVPEQILVNSTYIKMNNGNILICPFSINGIKNSDDAYRNSKVIGFFDCINGQIKKISYEELKELYDGDVEGNILMIF